MDGCSISTRRILVLYKTSKQRAGHLTRPHCILLTTSQAGEWESQLQGSKQARRWQGSEESKVKSRMWQQAAAICALLLSSRTNSLWTKQTFWKNYETHLNELIKSISQAWEAFPLQRSLRHQFLCKVDKNFSLIVTSALIKRRCTNKSSLKEFVNRVEENFYKLGVK